MDPSQNKRKVSESSSPPTTPHPPKGARFFPANFASPQTMPKRAHILPLAYLNSPTPAAPVDHATSTLPTPQNPAQEESTATAGEEDMEMSDPDELRGGVKDSMHAPKKDETPTPSAPLRPPTPAAAPRLRAPPDTPGLILSLSTIAETSPYMANFTSTAAQDEIHFTPPPADDFPVSHRGMAGEFLVGLNPEIIDAWCDLPAPKFFLRVFGYDGSLPHERHTTLIGLARIAFEEIAKSIGTTEPEARIAPPSPSTPPAKHPLITFIAYGMSTALADVILKQRVWSSDDITFEALPFEPDLIPSLAICIAGFTSPDQKAAQIAIKAAWSTTTNQDRLVETLQQHDPLFEGEDGKTDARKAISEMTHSTRVDLIDYKEQGGIPAPRFNVFITPPTSDMLAWTHIKKYLFSLTYPSILIGTGRCTPLFSCQICHSFSHPRGLCPFPTVPGWKGPKHEQEFRTTAMRGRGYGRGRSFRRGPRF